MDIFDIRPCSVSQWTMIDCVTESADLWCVFAVLWQVPEVIPSVINKSMTQHSTDDDDVYTVSCVAHFAFPPVDLVWVKGQRSSVYL